MLTFLGVRARSKLRTCLHGDFLQAKAAALGCVSLPRLSSATDGARCVRRSEGTRHHPCATLKKTLCAGCGHLGEALDKVRKSEYKRLAGRDRSFIKGQKYTLLSHRENLTLEGRKALEKLLAANRRLNKAYLLKESFGQLWDYQSEGWARRFFENWRASLKWQRLEPYVKFAEMIDRHWDGIAAYCKPENKV